MTPSIRTIVAVALLCAGAAAPLAAELGVDVGFSDGEVQAIRAWYSEHDHGGASGGHRKGPKSLPPGIAKNLQRGKPLPPGIAKQALPAGLVRVLPPVRDGYERIVVDGKILLVEIATRVIHDVLVDAVLK